LLGKWDELTGLLEVLTFQGAGGGERPARATLTLILNRSNVALGSPVFTI
jgi:hypothetical protein